MLIQTYMTFFPSPVSVDLHCVFSSIQRTRSTQNVTSKERHTGLNNIRGSKYDAKVSDQEHHEVSLKLATFTKM